MKKRIVGISVLAVIFFLINSISIWLSLDDPKYNTRIIILSSIVLIAVVSFTLKLIKKRKDALTSDPAEDEYTNQAKIIAGNQAFHYSLLLWLIIFIFNGSFSDNHEMLGVGILGSATIYGLLVWYYNSTGDFLNG